MAARQYFQRVRRQKLSPFLPRRLSRRCGKELKAKRNELKAQPQDEENHAQGNESPAQGNENIESSFFNRLPQNLAPSARLTLTFAARSYWREPPPCPEATTPQNSDLRKQQLLTLTPTGRPTPLDFPSDESALVRAFPPVAVLLVGTAPALQPRADLVPLRAGLSRLGRIAVTGLALSIRGQPRRQHWRLRAGRGAGHGQSERNRDHRPSTSRVKTRGR